MLADVRNLSFSYGERKVLDRITFSADKSTLIALIGRNGAGKSTLMRLMLGFLKPSEGSVTICGKNVSELSAPERARAIAYIPQSSPIVYSYSVKDIILMGRAPNIALFGRPGKDDERHADEAMALLGIEHLSSRPINEISGGEKQLALIARAIAQDARILLLDEPASSLDYGNQLMLLETLKKLRDKGYLIIFTSHTPEHALIADRILMLDDSGKLDYAQEDALSDKLSSLYGRKLFITKIDTGKHERTVCVPE